MRMNNHISFLLSNLHGGGVQRSTLNLLSGLADRGLEIELVLLRNEGVLRSRVPSTVSVVDLLSPGTALGTFALAKYLRHRRPTALISAQAHVNVSALLAVKLSRTKTRTLVVEHNSLSATAKYAKRMVDRLRPLLLRIFYPWADEVIAVSQGLAKEMEDHAGIPRAQIRVIYNPVVNAKMLQKAAQKVQHPWLKDPSTPLVLAVGRLSPQKDFSTLLQAFAHMLKKQKAKLLILGSGEERSKLEKKIKQLALADSVELLGHIENPYPYIAMADVLALSSAWEGLPTVLIEALALGTQVVSTNCPTGPVEILDHGRYGQLTPVGDAPALAEAIVKVLESPLPVEDLQARAQAFSVERGVEAYYQLLMKSA